MAVLTLADAKEHLGITTPDTDAELQSFIDAAEAALAGKIGPLGSTSRTDRVRGMGKELVVPAAPIITLTSVTPVGGTALDSTSMVVDYRAGVIAYVAATQYNFARFPLPWYDVVYTAGWGVTTSTFPDLYLAIKELVRVFWQTQRGNSPGSALPTDDGQPILGAAYSLERRVEQLIAPYVQPGFA